MWSDLNHEWQKTFEQAWTAFQNGSIPIGCVITDSSGNIIIAGRNETGERRIRNKRTAHAEMYCVRNLDIEKYPDIGQYHLYTTMEPCPMCMGTIAMGGIRKLHVAAKDKYCGALHYVDFDPYMQSKNMEIHLEEGEMQAVQLAQQGYYELKRYQGVRSNVLIQFEKSCPEAVEAAFTMYQESYLDQCVDDNVPYNEIYDYMCTLLKAGKNRQKI